MKAAMYSSNETPEANMRAAQAARGDVCRLLAACFYPPDLSLILQEGITENLAMLLNRICPEAALLAPVAPPDCEGNAAEGLLVAYTRLFLGSPETLAPPYASFFLDRRGRVMGPSSVAIMKLYQMAGLRLDDDFHDLPDHIAVMLEFMHYLIAQEIMADNRGDLEEKEKLGKMRRHFLENYMITWVPRFCDHIIAAEAHPFYTSLGRCLKMFMERWDVDQNLS